MIQNFSAKLLLANDGLLVATSAPSPVESLNVPEQFEDAAGSQDDIRVEASYAITSSSYGA